MQAFTLLAAILILIFPAKNIFAENNSDRNKKEDVVILFQASPAPLIDHSQYQLFQPLDTLDFDKVKQKSPEVPGQIPVFTPSFEGSLLIKEPENAQNGFLLIKDPIAPSED